jgi:hypothetical protein
MRRLLCLRHVARRTVPSGHQHLENPQWQIVSQLEQGHPEKFNADFDANVAKADKNWPALVAKHGK